LVLNAIFPLFYITIYGFKEWIFSRTK